MKDIINDPTNLERAVQIVDVIPGDDQLADEAHALFADLVANGAALGWVRPPPADEIVELLTQVEQAQRAGNAAFRCAFAGGGLVGLGYWRRYPRLTHWPHADLEKLAVRRSAQGRGVGRVLAGALIEAARTAGIEVLTLDVRGDNDRAAKLYGSLGFVEYGRLHRFVAVGDARYDKLLYALDLRPPAPT